MKLRKIKTNLLFKSAVVYRLSVITIQTMFFWIITGEFNLALGTSIGWNIINMAWYWMYHYSFAKMFKLSKDNNNKNDNTYNRKFKFGENNSRPSNENG